MKPLLNKETRVPSIESLELNGMKYEPRTFPDYFEDYDSLTPKEAKEYFEWYLEQVPKRINILMEYYYKTNPNAEPLDYSPQSLIPLWTWAEDKVEVEKKTRKEIKLEKKSLPRELRYLISEYKFSEKTEDLLTDISDYLAEVMIRNNPSIYWSYQTKDQNEESYNRPVLLGFEDDCELDAALVVLQQAEILFDSNDPVEDEWEDTDLYDNYCIYVDMIK